MTTDVETKFFELEGFADLEWQMKEIIHHVRADTAVRQNFVRALRVAMQPVYEEVKRTAPYDEENPRSEYRPLHMRDTVRLKARLPTDKDMQSVYAKENIVAVALVTVKKSAVSLAMEYGTSRIAPRAFMRTALKTKAEDALKILKQELSHMLPTYMAKLNKRKGK